MKLHKKLFKYILLLPLIVCFLSVGSVSAAVLNCSNYPLGCYEASTVTLYTVHPSAASASAVSQSFMTNFNDSTLHQVDMYMYKSAGAPVAILRCYLYSTSGTYGSTNVPNALIETSTTDFQVSGLGGSPTLVSFAFSDTNSLYAGTVYSIVVAVYSKTTMDASNAIKICQDTTVAAADGNGNGATYSLNAWGYTTSDFIHTVWGTNGQPVVYSGGDIYIDTQQTVTEVTIDSTNEFNNTQISAEGSTVGGAVDDTVSASSYILIILAIICIFLIIKPTIPILNFVFGTTVLGIAAWTSGQTLLMGGYLTFLSIVLALICMLSGYISWKR